MAVTEGEFAQFRNEFEAKFASANVDWMSAATAIGSYGERFTGMDARFTAIDERFSAVDAQLLAIHARIDALSADMDRRFEEVDRRFAEVDRRFDQVERRLDRLEERVASIETKLDSRFGWQTFMMAVLGFLILFGDTIRPLLGLG